MPNFKFLVPLVTKIWRGSQNTKWALLSAGLPRYTLAVKFLYLAIVPANACQHTKFQLSNSIRFGDMRESLNKKWELLISPDAPSGQIFIQGVSTRKCVNFKFLAPLVTEIWRGSQNKKWALLISPDAP